MLGRQVGTSLLRLPRCARLPIRSLPCQQSNYNLAIWTLAPSTHRFYAQITPSRPGRPKKAVGEPSRPVKRDVKRAAKSPKEDAATKKVKARKETAQQKTKAATKSAPKPRKQKELTEEQQARKAQREVNKAAREAKKTEREANKKSKSAKGVQQVVIAELKKKALNPPHVTQARAWNLFVKDRINTTPTETEGTTIAAFRAKFAEKLRQIREQWRNVTPAEQEHYNHLAHTARDQQQADYKRYVESHTVEEIEAANNARKSLRTKLKGNAAAVRKWPVIKDERAVKRPLSPYFQFSINRFASGDFKHIHVAESAKLIGQEWKALSDGEKQKYQGLYKQDAGRYNEEYTTVHGHAPAHMLGEQGAQAAAAAA